jgi:type I restriction enzyme, R subunit
VQPKQRKVPLITGQCLACQIRLLRATARFKSKTRQLYIFWRHLASRLPRRPSDTQYDFDSDVQLEYYRLQKISEGAIDLRSGYARPLDGPSEVGTGAVREQEITLLQLIDLINARFGTDFNQAGQLFFDQIVEAAAQSADLQQAAQVNSADKFALLFKRLLETFFIERMDQNEAIFARYMNDHDFQQTVSGLLVAEVYQRLTGTTLSTLNY